MRFVERHQSFNIDVPDAISVRHHERIHTNPGLQTLDPSSCLCRYPCVNQRNTPIRPPMIMDRLIFLSQVNSYVRMMKIKPTKVLFNYFALVPARHDELLMTMACVDAHDMPKHRLSTDLDHRLGHYSSVLSQSCAKSTSQDNDLHAHTSTENVGLMLTPST